MHDAVVSMYKLLYNTSACFFDFQIAFAPLGLAMHRNAGQHLKGVSKSNFRLCQKQGKVTSKAFAVHRLSDRVSSVWIDLYIEV